MVEPPEIVSLWVKPLALASSMVNVEALAARAPGMAIIKLPPPPDIYHVITGKHKK